MTKKINDLRAALFAAKDGSVACDAINSLAKLAKEGTIGAKDVLAAYVFDGPIDHMRTHACASLAKIVTEADAKFATLFRRGLSDEHLRYWSILGCIRSEGKSAFAELTRITRNRDTPLSVRCQAVKCLATFSRQPFDRHLPSDPGRWKEADLRLNEIALWEDKGYPDGQGYSEPKRHPALDEPKTAFEKIASRLDKRLARKRKARQDLADPTDWLAIASPEDIKNVKNRWNLPAVYLDFLQRFSPIQVTIESRRFYNHFQLFGAGELIQAQDGYSFNPIEQKPIDDWPAHLVVIASHGGDPFVLDLSESDGNDAPVATAQHGVGVWEFSNESDSFRHFLEGLAK